MTIKVYLNNKVIVDTEDVVGMWLIERDNTRNVLNILKLNGGSEEQNVRFYMEEKQTKGLFDLLGIEK